MMLMIKLPSRTSFLLSLLVSMVSHIQLREVGTCLLGSDRIGDNCHAQGEHWQHDGVCLLDMGTKRCHVPDTRTFEFNLRVGLRMGPLAQAGIIKNIYVAGAGPGLDWTQPKKLQKTASGVGYWILPIRYTYDSKALLCETPTYCTFNQRGLELRVYQDDSGAHDMVGPNIYVNLPIPGSISGHSYFTIPHVDVLPWFEGKTLGIDEFDVTASQLGTVHVTVFFPPSFDYNIKKQYPIVILFGLNVGVQAGPIFQFMYVQEASINEVIVLILHHNDTAPFCEFSPYPEGSNGENANLIWKCKREEDCRSCHHCWNPDEKNCTEELFLSTADECLFPTKCTKEPLGEIWLDTIENEIVPHVRELTKGRALTNFPINRLTIIGFDGLGLLACHAAITRPNIYQNAACLSPSLHWPLRSLTEKPKADDTGIGRAMKNFSHNLMFYPELFVFHTTQRYYLDYGEHDNKHFPFVNHEYYLDEFTRQLQNMFDVPDENVLVFKSLPHANNDYYQNPDGGTEILNRLKLPLLFFFRTEGNPNIAFYPLEDLVEEEIPEDENVSKIPEECEVERHMAYRREQLKDPSVPIHLMIIIMILCIALTGFLTVVGLTIYNSVPYPGQKSKKRPEATNLLEVSSSDSD